MPERPDLAPFGADGDLVVTCACGWTTQGPVDTVVITTQEHGLQLHNMDATREDVLAMARPVDR